VGAGLMTGVGLAELRSPAFGLPRERVRAMSDQGVDYTLHIKSSPIEIAPRRIVSAIAYNGQFPGPLLRFKENRPVTVDIFNETDTPEQLDWHGQKVGVDVDGAAEEGTPPIPAQGMRRISFTPNPSGLRFYHTHDRAGANLAAGRYGGEVGPVYIEPAQDPGRYDREIFLVLKDFEPTFRRGGDMNRDFLTPAQVNPELKGIGESSMKASLAKGRPHGYEVGYRSFTINRRMLGHGEPLRVKAGDRLRLHVLNGSATESHPRFSPASLRGSVFLQPVWIPRFDGHAR
jgi:FtsP/CotA-like multicopper oxidase with cupredoxin domain